MDLSPSGMFLHADIVVKIVMTLLALASMLAWIILIAKTIELRAARAGLGMTLEALGREVSLTALFNHQVKSDAVGTAFVAAAADEIMCSRGFSDKSGIKERIGLRLSRIEAGAVRRMKIGTGILATIGSTAPFIGLFGTVWGIMNSFIGISKAQTTNLAVVAPGIAEALLATAIGLVAAIPAVIIYNHLTRAIGGYKALVHDAGTLTMVLASRDMDRGTSFKVVAAE